MYEYQEGDLVISSSPKNRAAYFEGIAVISKRCPAADLMGLKAYSASIGIKRKILWEDDITLAPSSNKEAGHYLKR
jgi:hypothetical protein